MSVVIRSLVSAALLITTITTTTVVAQQKNDPVFSLRIAYLVKNYAEPLPLSLTEPVITDKGIQAARLAHQENQLTGRLLNQQYALTEHIVEQGDDVIAAAQALLANGEHFIVADLQAEDLLAIADLPEAADAIILNARAFDDHLRNEGCRANVFHVAPSYAMRADGLAQYLVWKKWRRWFVVDGKHPHDQLYTAALARAANKFGAKIVETRHYQFEAGARRVESGHQQIQTQMPRLTQGAAEHDVLVVADTGEAFGEYLPYRTFDARPVVGTHGLVSVAWHRAYEQFGSMSLHSAFEKLAGRSITERDYMVWLAVKTFTEAALRTGSAELQVVRDYLKSEKFVVPGFKGVGLSFRHWNHQLRQPMLIAWRGALVSVSPQKEFLHQRTATDSLGFDEPESACRFDDSA